MYITHITRDGDRYDLLADRYYGDVARMPDIIEANPHAPIAGVLPSGITLAIPVIEVAADTAEELPPWKR